MAEGGNESWITSSLMTETEIERTSQGVCVSDYKREKLEKESKKHWDLFYKRNSTHFFKDRHWCGREFPELLSIASDLETPRGATLLECGCGVGNLMFPLIQENPDIFIHGCDFSEVAIELVKKNELYTETRCNAFQCDLTIPGSIKEHLSSSVTMVSLVFVLSSISPDKMPTVVQNIAQVLTPGGFVLFRDYGVYDHAMMRFGPGHKIDTNYYFRQDWTRAYYFSLESIEQLFTSNNFKIVENKYVKRETVNKKEQMKADRIFVQGKYILSK